MSTKSFRKKPVEIQAMQWDGTAEGAIPIIDWILTGELSARYHESETRRPYGGPEEHTSAYIAIDTLEGIMSARAGDWVIRGVKGEFYPCKPDIFDATYERMR